MKNAFFSSWLMGSGELQLVNPFQFNRVKWLCSPTETTDIWLFSNCFLSWSDPTLV